METNIKYNIMKKLSIFLLSLIVFSCGEHEDVIYDPLTSTTFTFFDAQNTALELLDSDTSRTAEISVGVSTLSSSDRTVTLSVNEELSTADSASYDVISEVLIPANEYFGTATITAYPDNLVIAETVTIVLNIDSVSDGGITSSAVHSVGLSVICPVESTFAVGDYTLTFDGGGIGAAGNAPVWGDGTVIELTEGGSETERVFTILCYPSFGFAQPETDYSVTLLCGLAILNGEINNTLTGVACSAAGNISCQSTTLNGAYDPSDDSVITLIFAEDVGGISCGAEGITSYTFTKN
nr:hypothetical protein [uncultured bacterium]